MTFQHFCWVIVIINLQMGNVQDVRREMTKTKEQLEEEKKISLSIRIRPLELDGKTWWPLYHGNV